MELFDLCIGDFRELFPFYSICKGLLDGYLVLAGVLHQEDVDDVDDEEQKGMLKLYLVSIETVGEDDQIEQNENGLTSDDPPVNQSSRGDNQVEDAYTNTQSNSHTQ